MSRTTFMDGNYYGALRRCPVQQWRRTIDKGDYRSLSGKLERGSGGNNQSGKKLPAHKYGVGSLWENRIRTPDPVIENLGEKTVEIGPELFVEGQGDGARLAGANEVLVYFTHGHDLHRRIGEETFVRLP
jgi:hypothetical protein